MASKYWWIFLGALFFAAVLLKIYPLVAFILMLAIVSGLARWWRQRSLDGVIYRRQPFYRRGFPGEKVAVQVEVENKKFLPLAWLRVDDEWPFPVAPEDPGLLNYTHKAGQGVLVNLFSLRWFDRARRAYTLVLRQRGVYGLGPVRFESGDLFGMFNQVREDPRVEYLTVFPQPVPFEALRLPAQDPFGDRRARRRLYEDPNQPMGVREYHPEDDFRRVHWPATAHTGELQVKVYQPASAQVMVVCLNISTLSRYWEGTYPEMLEHLLGVSATLVQQGLGDGYRVGLISNGCLAHSDQPFRVPPGRSSRQLAHLLGTLAAVTPLVTGPFDRFLMSEVPRLPYGASLIIVTGVMTDSIAEALVRLKQHGRRITLLLFAPTSPPEIPGITVVHRPFQP